MNPDSKMEGRVVVLTGATGKIGKEIAMGIAEKGGSLILATRNVESGKAVAKEIMARTKNTNVQVEQVDLASARSIANFAARVSARPNARLDVLINNAAIVPRKREKSVDGLELQFATNVLSYFLLTALFQPLLKHTSELSRKAGTGPTRIVNVASMYAGGLDLSDLHFEKRKYDPNQAYRQSKQANRMLSWEAAKRYEGDGIIVHSCHPGVVSSKVLSGLGFGVGFDTAAKGAATPVFLASAPAGRLGTGRWWKNGRQLSCKWQKPKEANNEALWERCEQLRSSLLSSGKGKPGPAGDEIELKQTSSAIRSDGRPET